MKILKHMFCLVILQSEYGSLGLEVKHSGVIISFIPLESFCSRDSSFKIVWIFCNYSKSIPCNKFIPIILLERAVITDLIMIIWDTSAFCGTVSVRTCNMDFRLFFQFLSFQTHSVLTNLHHEQFSKPYLLRFMAGTLP